MIQDLENSIVDLELQKLIGEVLESRVSKIIERLETSIENEQQKLQEIETEIEKNESEKLWLDWVSKYGEKIKLETSSETKQKEFLHGVLDMIVVNSHYQNNTENKEIQFGHSFLFHFKMNIVDDKLVYKDNDNKSKDYNIIKGKNIGVGDTEKFSTPRVRQTKKKSKVGDKLKSPLGHNR